MARVRIAGTERVFEADEGTDLLDVLQAAGFPIATSCGGRASCGLCRLTVVSGKEWLSPLCPEEVVHLGNVAKVIGTRLACQARVGCEGEIAVEVPTVEDVEARKRQKAERMQRERAANRPRFGEARVPTPQAPRVAERPRVEWRPRKLEAKPEGEGSKGGP